MHEIAAQDALEGHSGLFHYIKTERKRQDRSVRCAEKTPPPGQSIATSWPGLTCTSILRGRKLSSGRGTFVQQGDSGALYVNRHCTWGMLVRQSMFGKEQSNPQVGKRTAKARRLENDRGQHRPGASKSPPNRPCNHLNTISVCTISITYAINCRTPAIRNEPRLRSAPL